MEDFDTQALDRARLSRDPRFDGRFFIAVTSTGIYCRPICPVRSPKRDNIRYYPTAAAAAEAGYRPCLRCRPEAAPGTSAWLGTSAVVRRALRLIDDGLLDKASVDVLASRLGIGPRHLHRLFMQHVGASPISVAQTRRLHFAKRLLDETGLQISDIALASGFGSVRSFNSAFQHAYHRPPRELRKQRRHGVRAEADDEVVLRLPFRPPYDWSAMLDFLGAHAVPGVERVDARGYARTVATAKGDVVLSVTMLVDANALELRLRRAAPGALLPLSSAARRMFDVTADPGCIARAFESDPLLAPLVQRSPGLRIPGAWDAFECAVRALLSGEATRALVARAGRPIESGADGLTHLFPSPQELAAASLDGLGLTAANVIALRALARIDFHAPPETVTASLAALPGFGAGPAQYVALRALNEPDAFPMTAPALEACAESWRPWRGYAALLLWRERAL